MLEKDIKGNSKVFCTFLEKVTDNHANTPEEYRKITNKFNISMLESPLSLRKQITSF